MGKPTCWAASSRMCRYFCRGLAVKVADTQPASATQAGACEQALSRHARAPAAGSSLGARIKRRRRRQALRLVLRSDRLNR